jgi:hypothetical protein
MKFLSLFSSSPSRIDYYLFKMFGSVSVNLEVINTVVPYYRLADIHKMMDRFCEGHTDVTALTTKLSHEPLAEVFLPTEYAHIREQRKISAPELMERSISAQETELFAGTKYWIVKPCNEHKGVVLRVNCNPHQRTLEFSSGCRQDDKVARELIKTISQDLKTRSIYKGGILNVSYSPSVNDEYGDVGQHGMLSVDFSAMKPVERSDIILSNEHVELLQRNVVDIFERSAFLAQYEVPQKRGVLLHGPPGTGKTFACKYICGQLSDVTRIFISGSALTAIDVVFSLANFMAPSIIFIEDADLVFQARDTNLYSTVLGDFMDQLDGLEENKNISTVLTTNSIERLEGALKDRPGRISQCIYMGEPDRELRRNYLMHHMQNLPIDELDMDHLTKVSSGASQAFLKEWVHRSVQFATETMMHVDDPLVMKTTHFDDALSEMRGKEGDGAHKIIGFNR